MKDLMVLDEMVDTGEKVDDPAILDKKKPLTKAQKARKAKNKVAKQSRKKNRPR